MRGSDQPHHSAITLRFEPPKVLAPGDGIVDLLDVDLAPVQSELRVYLAAPPHRTLCGSSSPPTPRIGDSRARG